MSIQARIDDDAEVARMAERLAQARVIIGTIVVCDDGGASIALHGPTVERAREWLADNVVCGALTEEDSVTAHDRQRNGRRWMS